MKLNRIHFETVCFLKKKNDRVKSVYGSDCLELIKNDYKMLAVSDDDAVRLCLLVVAILVFMGNEYRNCIPNHLLSLVEDLDS